MSKKDQKAEAMVSLALELTKGTQNVVGEPVSDEELAAYIENSLDDVRRAQVSSYIANDQSVYSRWLKLVENEDIIFSSEEPEVKGVGQKVYQFGAWIVNSIQEFIPRNILVPGGVMAAVGIMTFYMFQPTSSLDKLYAGYQVSDDSLMLHLPSRSFDPLRELVPATNEGIIINEGVDQGLVELGVFEKSDLVGNSVKISAAKNQLTKSDRKVYEQLGRWSVLSHYQCLQQNQDYFEPALSVFTKIEGQLVHIDTEYARNLEQEFSGYKNETVKIQVCEIAFMLIEKASVESIK